MDCCCTTESPAPTKSRSGRIWGLIQWTAAITTLAIVPKCPACFATYFLLFTGVGISLSLATTLRWTLIALGTAAIAYLFVRTAQRMLTRCV